ncbi:hypothetical protein EVAR_95404_1 [Eumeta japonica]|uniref:Uncharacterized protein n=1 Tax=Eumeta variegata TaxID=151549 RepID=A0A4C1VKV9_EUMVA|nr:hypothetical protein EVAR_95404_1 [Eumeta japonica]
MVARKGRSTDSRGERGSLQTLTRHNVQALCIYGLIFIEMHFACTDAALVTDILEADGVVGARGRPIHPVGSRRGLNIQPGLPRLRPPTELMAQRRRVDGRNCSLGENNRSGLTIGALGVCLARRALSTRPAAGAAAPGQAGARRVYAFSCLRPQYGEARSGRCERGALPTCVYFYFYFNRARRDHVYCAHVRLQNTRQ